MELDPPPLPLFDGQTRTPRRVRQAGLDLEFHEGWVAPGEANTWFEGLFADTPWEQPTLTLFGRAVPVPRKTAWYGDPDTAYRYSGTHHEPLPWTALLSRIRQRVQDAVPDAPAFNSVLLNLYETGAHGVAWHADDEPELGPAPTIASLSLGAPRTFQMRHRDHARYPERRLALDLPAGSLLIMRPPTQREWRHQVPKRSRTTAPTPRINLTFRHVHATR